MGALGGGETALAEGEGGAPKGWRLKETGPDPGLARGRSITEDARGLQKAGRVGRRGTVSGVLSWGALLPEESGK